tara:strand:- start:432 stop:746 length:315 start_codon:yes stop_codon:yes gene_type:complete
MPSYYDSTKKKPGTAKVKYEKGGKVSALNSKKMKKPSPFPDQKQPPALTASQKEALQKASDEKWRKEVDKASTTKTTMGERYAKGGQVRGMGAATRGGNFSRNG